MQNIERKLKEYLDSSSVTIQEILMVSNIEHPKWEDNSHIIKLAIEQILQPVGALPDEYVYSYVGMHLKIPVVGKRHSIGFIVTNLRVLVQGDVSFVGRNTGALGYQFTQNQDAKELFNKVWNDFTVKFKLDIPKEQLKAMQVALREVIQIILPEIQSLNILPDEVKKATTIKGRIMELGIKSELKPFEDNKKNFVKFMDKYHVADVLYGVVMKPLLASPYGLVITPTGITSRDLMEECVSST
ncbi:hypothetical protein [Myroides sp. LoEW2-1]|nr:hypothetical protein [Myroides sp. LoEW2-1]MVX35692.1 hypothetical protein [Myroides sp. LoEW2-1]